MSADKDPAPSGAKEKPTPLIAPRVHEDDEEMRFREALERLGSQIMLTVDSAIQMRAAAAVTQRSRHTVRSELSGALLRALNTFHLNRSTGPAKPTKPRSI